MRVHLLNAAVMPAADGVYKSHKISKEDFIQRARKAYDAGELVSYIGYKTTAEIMSDLFGFLVRESRLETHISDGDQLLIARLNYRLGEGPKRDVKPSIDDFEFRVVSYAEW